MLNKTYAFEKVVH